MNEQEFVTKALENFTVNAHVVKTVVDGRTYRVPYTMVRLLTLKDILAVFYDMYLREYYIENAKSNIRVKGKVVTCIVDDIVSRYMFECDEDAYNFYILAQGVNHDIIWNKLYVNWLHQKGVR